MSRPRVFAWGLLTGAALVGMLYSCAAHAGTAMLTWVAPTQNTDGSAIVGAIHYRVYKGTQGQVIKPQIASGLTALTYTVTGINGGTACFNVTAVVAGIVSAPSNEACKTFVPNAPVIAP